MLSITFEGGGYLGKAPTGEYSSCYPCTSIQNKLTSNWVFGVKIPDWDDYETFVSFTTIV